MSQTLRYLDGLLAGFPDNTTGLISAENQRDVIVSNVSGKGAIEDTTEITVPILDGVPTDLNLLLTAPLTIEGLWGVDGNHHLHPQYELMAGTIVPPGYSKSANLIAVLSLEKTVSQTHQYDVQFFRAGTPIGVPATVEFDAGQSETVTVLGVTLVDISVASNYYITITGLGHSVDLIMHSFEMNVSDNVLTVAP